MSDDSTPFIAVPFNPRPVEKEEITTPEAIQQQKEYIRANILGQPNEEMLPVDRGLVTRARVQA